jgi:HEAT repeat protein
MLSDPLSVQRMDIESINELLMQIGDLDKGSKFQAMEQIVKIGLDNCYPALDSAIRNNDNADLRNAAMEVMVRFAGSAIPRLVNLLHDKDEEVRNFSTVMLGEIANREAVGALVVALRDKDANVRHGAAEALGNIGDRSALFPILELLKEDFWSQYPAIVALGEMRDPRAIPYLLKLLDDDMVGVPAIIALGKIGDPRVLFTLGEILAAEPVLRSGAAVEAIVAIERNRHEVAKYKHSLVLFAQADMSLSEILPKDAGLHLQRILKSASSEALKDAAISLLGWLGDTASLPMMIALAEDEEGLAASITASLTAMGNQVVPAIEKYLDGSSPKIQAILLSVLRQLKHDPDIHFLKHLLETSTDELLSETLEIIKGKSYPELHPSLASLASRESGSVQDLVVDVLTYYPHDVLFELIGKLNDSAIINERIAAVKLMARICDERFVEQLSSILNDNDMALKREAIKTIGKGKYFSLQPLLLDLLTTEDIEIRKEVVRSLAEFASPEHLDAILGLLGKYDDSLDFAIIKAVGKIRSPLATKELLDYLDRENISSHLLVCMLEVVGEIGSNDDIARNSIVKFLNHHENDIRRISITVYAKMAGESAWPKILAACSDPHWSVRIAALHAAIFSNGDKALLPLLEALRDPDILVRKNAIQLMGELQNIRALTPLIQLLLDPDLGLSAFEALRKFGRYGLPWLHRAIKGDYPMELRERVIDLIGIIGDRKSVEPLLEALEDTNQFIRLAAVDSLVFCYDSLPLKKLAHIKKFDSNDDVRNKADLALQLLTMERYF